MKKILYTFLVAALVLVSASEVHATSDIYYTNNEGLNMTEKQYNNLLNQGFSEKQIERMDYTTFEDNKDIEAQIVAMDKKYVKTTTTMRNGIEYHTSQILTEEEMMAEVQAAKEQPPYPQRDASGSFYNGTSYDDYRAIQTVISYLDDYDVMRYKLDTYWFIMPSTRSYDIIGIGIDANKVQIDSNIILRQDWWKNNVSDYSTIVYEKILSTGGLAMFPLPSGSLDSLESYMYFTVDKLPGVNTVTSLTANGDYAHATTTVSNAVYNYMSVNVAGGIIISNPYANSYDETTPAAAYFTGTW